MGQTKNVKIVTLCMKGTIEERMLELRKERSNAAAASAFKPGMTVEAKRASDDVSSCLRMRFSQGVNQVMNARPQEWLEAHVDTVDSQASGATVLTVSFADDGSQHTLPAANVRLCKKPSETSAEGELQRFNNAQAAKITAKKDEWELLFGTRQAKAPADLGDKDEELAAVTEILSKEPGEEEAAEDSSVPELALEDRAPVRESIAQQSH